MRVVVEHHTRSTYVIVLWTVHTGIEQTDEKCTRKEPNLVRGPWRFRR